MPRTRPSINAEATWPPLPLEAWHDTRTVLHLWTQIVGKVRLDLAPPLNHWWHVALQVSARGLTTGLIPRTAGGLQIDFDFFDHNLLISESSGRQRRITLPGRSVAGLYRELTKTLADLGIEVEISPRPFAFTDAVPFPEDTRSAYDAGAVQRFWRLLTQACRIFERFRGRFVGKTSPTQFFWGTFDLATSRFSGRMATPPQGTARLPASVLRDAYSHEVYSVGFRPGGHAFAEPAFYAHAYPEPAGFRRYPVRPGGVRFDDASGAFVLPYEAVRTATDPDSTLLAFLESSYRAVADTGKWDPALEASPDRS